jgi:hypothetical protein
MPSSIARPLIEPAGSPDIGRASRPGFGRPDFPALQLGTWPHGLPRKLRCKFRVIAIAKLMTLSPNESCRGIDAARDS